MNGEILRTHSFDHLQLSQLGLKTVHVAPLKRDLKAAEGKKIQVFTHTKSCQRHKLITNLYVNLVKN